MLTVDTLDELATRLAEAPAVGADLALARPGRRARGAYFTPPPLAELIAAETVRARFAAGDVAWRDDGTPALIALDPAAGDGRFLAAVHRVLVDRAVARGAERAIVGPAIAAQCLVGIERDPAFAERARATGATIHCREALIDAPALAPVDIVVGNPPYQRSIHLAEEDPALWRALRGRYEATSHGEWDLYGAFLEQSLAWLAPRGQAGLVVPSRWMTAAFGARLRHKLGREGAVRAIVDFGAMQIFAGATTYPAVAFLSRAPCRDVQVLRWNRSWSAGRVPADSLTAPPWRLSVGEGRRTLDRLASGGPTLGEVVRIAKGAGTNADRVYVVTPVERDGELLRVRSTELGQEVELEAALCRPVYRGRDVRAGAGAPAHLCLVPYDREGTLVSPEELAVVYPRTWAYFERCRARLDRRERGRFRGDTFYRFGRPQNMAWLLSAEAKVVVPDVAREGRAVLDGSGAFVLDSAYAMRLRGDHGYTLADVAAVLGSDRVGLWLRETGVPLRGGYVRMKTAYLATMPLPPPGSIVQAAEHGAR